MAGGTNVRAERPASLKLEPEAETHLRLGRHVDPLGSSVVAVGLDAERHLGGGEEVIVVQ